jgi:hypothetical protein
MDFCVFHTAKLTQFLGGVDFSPVTIEGLKVSRQNGEARQGGSVVLYIFYFVSLYVGFVGTAS